MVPVPVPTLFLLPPTLNIFFLPFQGKNVQKETLSKMLVQVYFLCKLGILLFKVFSLCDDNQ